MFNPGDQFRKVRIPGGLPKQLHQLVAVMPHGMVWVTPAVLVVFARVLNLGDAHARGTFAGEPQQFVAGDLVAQLLGDQCRCIGAHGLQHLLLQGGISGDVSKKLPELVRAHAAGAIERILPALALPLAC